MHKQIERYRDKCQHQPKKKLNQIFTWYTIACTMLGKWNLNFEMCLSEYLLKIFPVILVTHRELSKTIALKFPLPKINIYISRGYYGIWTTVDAQ